MVKHTLTIRQLLPTNCLRVFDHFVGLALKGLIIKYYDHSLDNTIVHEISLEKKKTFIQTYTKDFLFNCFISKGYEIHHWISQSIIYQQDISHPLIY